MGVNPSQLPFRFLGDASCKVSNRSAELVEWLTSSLFVCVLPLRRDLQQPLADMQEAHPRGRAGHEPYPGFAERLAGPYAWKHAQFAKTGVYLPQSRSDQSSGP